MKRLRFINKAVNSPLWKRILAFILDVLILDLVIISPFQKFFKGIVPENVSFKGLFSYFMEGTFDLSKLLIAALFIMLITLFYWALLEWKLGQSVGKLVLNIFVRSTKKEKLTLGQCFVRNLSKVSTLLLFFDVLYMLLRKQNQRWLEEVSNTEVVENVEGVVL